MEVVTDTSGLEAAWSGQYVRLSHVFSDAIGIKKQRVVEIGCGRGQLTLPLAKRARNVRFVLVDRFVGTNYSTNYRKLVGLLKKTKLAKRAEIIVSDYMKWLNEQPDCTYEAVISSEFLPEIDATGTHHFMQQCYRVLKPEGVTAHSFLSPTPRNIGQALLITADSNPVWTRTPPKEWFSPKPELVVREMRRSGFHRIRKTALKARMTMKADAAKIFLRNAEVRASFYRSHRWLLNESGLEVPDWVVVSGVKS